MWPKPKRKTFILCLGHQRCGTTWLHEHLAQSDHFAGGGLKEYHIWDALDSEALQEHKLVLPQEDNKDPNYLRIGLDLSGAGLEATGEVLSLELPDAPEIEFAP